MHKKAAFRLGRLGLCSLATSLAVLGISGSARADHAVLDTNGSGLDTHLFRPAVDSKGLFSTNGTDILGDRDISFGLVIDYGRTLLRVPSIPGDTPHLINNSFQGTFQFNYGLLNQLVLGIDIPFNLMAGDARTAPGENGWTLNQLDSQTLGNIALHAKWRITRVEHGLGLAIVGQVGVPLTDAPHSAGADPTVWFWPQAVIEKRFGSTGALRLAANAGVRLHGSSGTVLPLENGLYKDGSLFTYGGGASLRVLDPLDLVAETYASYLLNDSDAAVKPSNEVVGGLKLFIDKNSYLMLGAGPRYTNGFEAADFRAFLGFIFEPSIGDRDGDGIKDDVDQCPDDPEDRDGFKDEDGCPDPDNDNDGTLDVDDRCPNIPGPKETFGCPSAKDGDRDGDGIPDSKDKCPDDPEDKDGFQDLDGCPDPDNDMDGIPDKKDACPNDPEDKDGFQDEDGCPDPDNDHDGIPDVRDKCPNEPETFNGYEDEDGCPDKGMVIIEDKDIKILKKVQFKTGSAEILPASNEILDAVATTLIHHPEFTLIEVAGHADERATDAYNLKLTQDRVNSVMAALSSRGVARGSLRAKGYGEYCPEDPEHNEAAYETNRRVEFKIVKTKEGPTGVELGCENASAHGVKPEPVPN